MTQAVMSPTERDLMIQQIPLIQEEISRRQTNQLRYFRPNRHQQKFLNKTAYCEELYLSGGNRTGKTTTGGLGVAVWATGRYPEWWKGKRFDGPVRIMVLGETDRQLRKAAQRILLGEENQWGTGFLPKDAIENDGKKMIHMKHDPKGCVDFIQIKNEWGGYSYIYFNTYTQGREAVQGDEIHVVWCDEPPKYEIYGELLARILTTNGIIFTTGTPMIGSTEVYERFQSDYLEDEETSGLNRRFFMSVSQNEAEHLTEEERKRFWDQCPPHERMARIDGMALLGDSQVYECTREMIICEPFDISKKSWLRFIIGMDFGYNDPTAAILIAFDPNVGGSVYIVRIYQKPKKLPDFHAIQLKRWGEGIPVAWPRDGHRIGIGSSNLLKIKDQYRQAGLNMLPKPAFSTYNAPTEGSNLEAGIQIVYELIQSGQLKIFDTPENQAIIKQFVQYHRKDGKIADQNDHLVDAARVGLCSIKYAQAAYEIERKRSGFFEKTGKKARTSYSLN